MRQDGFYFRNIIEIWEGAHEYFEITSVISIISQIGIFDFHETIYKEGSVLPIINHMRTKIFRLAGLENVYPLLLEASEHPFMFTECLVRIMLIWDDVQLTNGEDVVLCAIRAAHQLKQFASDHPDDEYVWKARSHNLLFLFQTCTNSELLTAKWYSDGFMWFIFDDILRAQVFKVFKNNLATFKKGEVGATSTFLSRVVRNCAKNGTWP